MFLLVLFFFLNRLFDRKTKRANYAVCAAYFQESIPQKIKMAKKGELCSCRVLYDDLNKLIHREIFVKQIFI